MTFEAVCKAIVQAHPLVATLSLPSLQSLRTSPPLLALLAVLSPLAIDDKLRMSRQYSVIADVTLLLCTHRKKVR